MVDQDIGSFLEGVFGADGAVGFHFEGELLVVGLLLDTPVVHAPVDLADRSVDGIHGDGADRRVLLTAFLGGHEAAALGDGQGDFELHGRLETADMLLQVQHLERRQSFGDVLGGKLMLAADGNVHSLGIDGFDHSAEPHLLEVEDDVLHALDDTGDGLEFLVDADNLDL